MSLSFPFLYFEQRDADLSVSCSAEFPESEGAIGGLEEGRGGEAEDEGFEEPYEEAVGWGVYNHVIPILVSIARAFDVFETFKRRLFMRGRLLRILKLPIYENDSMGYSLRSWQERCLRRMGTLGNGYSRELGCHWLYYCG